MLFMKRFLIILILIFTLQTPSQADDIRDFQIEGVSVGDSLLDYMSKKQILNNIVGIYNSKSKFITVNYAEKKNTFEHLYVYVKRRDKNYKIHVLRGLNSVGDKDSCLKTKKEIEIEMKSLFPKATFQEGSQKHYAYKKSIQYISQFYYGSDGRFSDGARVECSIIHKDEKKKYNIKSSLEVIIQYGGEFGRWLETDDARPS